MATTPPPGDRRLHTPPAPLHGVRYDLYEPYSPRRSSRVASQRERYSQSPVNNSPISRRRQQRPATPTRSSKQQHHQTIQQTFSPAVSSDFPSQHPSSALTCQKQPARPALDSDSDHPPPRASRFLAAMESDAILPTPAKTPHKRTLQSQETLGSTARVLFIDRPATIEEAMPTPRKSRKNRKNVYSLESFAEQDEEKEQEIEIYTDSKERLPELDESEDNPFVTKKSRRGNGRAEAGPSRSSRQRDARTARMEEAAANDEGIIYVFRGRKVFRKFNNRQPSNMYPEAADFSGDEMQRRAGVEASRPFTRSSIKPRRLWPSAEQPEKGLDDADEEAVTDIEAPVATPASRKTRKAAYAATPIKLNFTPATPPSTVRAKHGGEDLAVDVDTEAETSHASAPEEVEAPPVRTTRSKKASLFASWKRVKSSGSQESREGSKHSSKREGEPLESMAKRTRSAGSAADA
ncbi:hypothetical protein GQ43DRAFT_445323 [Delitschia confertaspora ATCC 74209]|uniref:Uncharacterized protein n=1 Tax=Delitschia confertaspora ATCC 74209 TaxID=1513339 RepID=A0A9P4MQP9_9PLEO|nr:hypothetical protein GQ43DRAFT_445323 [Delitschia confertaspora ATCC 74209]